MKINKYLLPILFFFIIGIACSDMNDKHDFYLKDGEILYIGRVDSVKILPGNHRFLLRYWITDLRTKDLHIYWNQQRDSLMIPIPDHHPSDSMEVLIGGDEKNIPEGNYTFQLVTGDGTGLKSIIFEKLGNVYGEQFSSTLTERFIKSVSYDPDLQTVTVQWGEPSSSREIGVEMIYYQGDVKRNLRLSTEEIDAATVIEGINVEKGVAYRTMFLPEPAAIDTFFTDVKPITVLQNVALNQQVKTSSNLNDSFSGSKAVDGIISTDSRWISSSAEGLEHWIEIDLDKEYSLYSFKLYKHLYNEFLIPNFIIQVEKNGEWVDVETVENYLGEIYEAIFEEEITTSKIRLFIPKYEKNMARIMEIAVYVKY
ncbi:MAG: DUF4998 domain-containing protein [Parabacteroides sp.]|nr:DUF4998 domain-containing protein [Parabacteroides sp.]